MSHGRDICPGTAGTPGTGTAAAKQQSSLSRVYTPGVSAAHTPNDKEQVMYRAMLLGALLSGMTFAPAVMAGPRVEEFHAVFSGFNEIGSLTAPSGAIMSDGRATLELRLDRANQTLSYVLKFSGLSAAVTQAHIHFGKIHVAGGVMVFFCS